MTSIFDLEMVSTSINDALRANREGNSARRQEALKTAFSVLQGAQTAADTQATIQRTSQAGKLFPSALTTAQEGAKQAGQDTALGDIKVRGAQKSEAAADALEEAFARQLIKMGKTPSEFRSEQMVAEGEEATEQAIVGKKFAEPEAGAKLDESRARAKLARAQAGKATADKVAKKTPTEIFKEELRGATKADGTPVFSEQQIANESALKVLVEAKRTISQAELTKMKTDLKKLAVNVQRSATLEEATESTGVLDDRTQAIMQLAFGGGNVALTTIEDKNSSLRILMNAYNSLLREAGFGLVTPKPDDFLTEADFFIVDPAPPPPTTEEKAAAAQKQQAQLESDAADINAEVNAIIGN